MWRKRRSFLQGCLWLDAFEYDHHPECDPPPHHFRHFFLERQHRTHQRRRHQRPFLKIHRRIGKQAEPFDAVDAQRGNDRFNAPARCRSREQERGDSLIGVEGITIGIDRTSAKASTFISAARRETGGGEQNGRIAPKTLQPRYQNSDFVNMIISIGPLIWHHGIARSLVLRCRR